MSKILVIAFFTMVLPMEIFAQHLQVDPGFTSRYDFNTNQGEIMGIMPIGNSDIILYGEFYDPSHNYRFNNLLKLNKYGQLDFTWAYTNQGPGQTVDNMWKLGSDKFIVDVGWGSISCIDTLCNITNQSWSYNLNRIKLTFMAFDDQFNSYPILAAGYPMNGTPATVHAVCKIDSFGHYDSSFTHQVIGEPFYITTCKNGSKLLSGPNMAAYDGHYSNDIIRIDSLGYIDTTFTCDIQLSWLSQVRRVFELKDGKILAIGTFENANGDVISIARLLPNGHVDTSFSTTTNATFHSLDTQINDLAPYKDGYIIVGCFTEINGVPRGNVALLDSTGNLDTTEFNSSGFEWLNNRPNNSLSAVDRIFFDRRIGKYYLCGQFDHYNGIPVQPIVRFKETMTGLDDHELQSKAFTITPNPSSTNEIYIAHKSPFYGQSIVNVYTLTGERISSQKMDFTSGGQSLSIARLDPGIYFLEIIQDELKSCAKFIKAN